jgi:hypothetical protein
VSRAEIHDKIVKMLGRKAKKLGDETSMVELELAPTEQVMDASLGSWQYSKNCLVVVTSRQVVVAGGRRVESFELHSLEMRPHGRSQLELRTQGKVADLNLTDREKIEKLIRMGARTRSTSTAIPQPPPV